MSPTEIDNIKYCDTLDVSPTFDHKELEMAYRNSAIQNEIEKIKESAEAYEEMGAMYDKYRELHQYDILDPVFCGTAFAGGAGASSSLCARFGDDFEDIVTVSLEDLYNGTTKKLPVSRYISCQNCKGKGTKTCRPRRYYAYQGSGFKMMQGSGGVVSEQDKCPSCEGSKICEEIELLEVIIYKGMKNGQKIVFENQGNKAPGTISGDIVLILQQIDHPKFQRRQDNLFVEHPITLIESLCGFKFSLTHLDERKLVIKSNPGEVIMPGESMAIYNEGMPQLMSPFTRGTLFIRFKVKFPDSGFFSPEQSIANKEVLPLLQQALELEQLEETPLWRMMTLKMR